jgi:hypothetical protein
MNAVTYDMNIFLEGGDIFNKPTDAEFVVNDSTETSADGYHCRRRARVA